MRGSISKTLTIKMMNKIHLLMNLMVIYLQMMYIYLIYIKPLSDKQNLELPLLELIAIGLFSLVIMIAYSLR